MNAPRKPRSRWADGPVYAATVDRLLSGVRDYVAGHLPPGERVLDACCGTGALSRRLAQDGRDVVGVDLSPRHIAYARDAAAIAFALHEMPTAARPDVVDALLRVAYRAMVIDFVAPMPWNLAGLRNRAAELAAGPEHFRSFLDYSRNGGLTPLVERDGVRIEHDRTIDAGTLRVVHLASA